MYQALLKIPRTRVESERVLSARELFCTKIRTLSELNELCFFVNNFIHNK